MCFISVNSTTVSATRCGARCTSTIFSGARLPVSREGPDWGKALRLLVIYRLLSPGSEWRLPRQWFAATALGDLLGVDARAVQDDTLSRCHDLLLPLKEELFAHLRQRWSDLFGARYEVGLYDLTNTHFECDVPTDETDPRRFGYSRDKRGDCVQVVVALIVTPEGLPAGVRDVSGQPGRAQATKENLGSDPKSFPFLDPSACQCHRVCRETGQPQTKYSFASA